MLQFVLIAWIDTLNKIHIPWNNRVFHKHTILAILASEALICENKKKSGTKCYLQRGLNPGPLSFSSDALLSELARHVLVRGSLNCHRAVHAPLDSWTWRILLIEDDYKDLQAYAKLAQKGQYQT